MFEKSIEELKTEIFYSFWIAILAIIVLLFIYYIYIVQKRHIPK